MGSVRHGVSIVAARVVVVWLVWIRCDSVECVGYGAYFPVSGV